MTIGDLPYIARLRLRYSMLGELPGACRLKRRLDVLLADDSLSPDSIRNLAGSLQLLNWLFEETEGATDLRVALHVLSANSTATSTLENLGLAYSLVNIDGADLLDDTVARIDSDVVFATAVDADRGDATLFVSSVEEILREAEVFARGFGIAWSFALPMRNQPWTEFYAAFEQTTMRPLMTFAEALKPRGAEGSEALRVLIYNTIPNLCFARDKLAFYESQRRAAQRAGAERQQYAFETAYHLNHFYITLYAGMDQAAIMVNGFLALGVAETEVGATYRNFRRALSAWQTVFETFNDAAFDELMERVKLLRRQAAHRMPLRPTTVYHGEDFTDEQLDAKAAEMGLTPDLSLFPPGLHEAVIGAARLKAQEALMTVAAERVIVVRDQSGTYIVSPDPSGDFEKFQGFLVRVLTAVQLLP